MEVCMFPHWLAGCIVFLISKEIYSIDLEKTFFSFFDWWIVTPDKTYLIFGAFVASLPDLMSINHFEYSKWSHKHRDNFSHSIFFPLFAFFLLPFIGFEWALLLTLTLLTHPFIDLYGIGWGVKLFYLFSNTTYKTFYKGRVLVNFSQEEIDKEAEKYGDENWLKNIYFSLHPWGIYEWATFIIFLFFLFFY